MLEQLPRLLQVPTRRRAGALEDDVALGERRDRRAYEGLVKSFADLGEHAQYAAAAAWSLVHGLSHLILDGHFEGRDRKKFVRDVLASVRFRAPRKA